MHVKDNSISIWNGDMSLPLAFWNNAIGGGINCGTGASVANLTQGTVMAWYRPDSVANALRSMLGKFVLNGGIQWDAILNTDGTTSLFTARRATTNHTITSPTGYNKANVIMFTCISWDINTSANALMWGNYNGEAAIAVAATVVAGSGSPADDSATNLELLAPQSVGNRFFGNVWALGLWNTPITDIGFIHDWQFNPRPTYNGCVGYWDASNGGILIPDLSGKGNHGVGTSVLVNTVELPYVKKSGKTRTLAFAESII